MSIPGLFAKVIDRFKRKIVSDPPKDDFKLHDLLAKDYPSVLDNVKTRDLIAFLERNTSTRIEVGDFASGGILPSRDNNLPAIAGVFSRSETTASIRRDGVTYTPIDPELIKALHEQEAKAKLKELQKKIAEQGRLKAEQEANRLAVIALAAKANDERYLAGSIF